MTGTKMCDCRDCGSSIEINRRASSTNSLCGTCKKRKQQERNSRRTRQTPISLISDRVCCLECKREFSLKGIFSHIWRVHGEGKSRRSWNKGLTKDSDETVKQISEKLKEGYKNGRKVCVPDWTGKKHAEKTKKKLSEIRVEFLKKNPDKVPYLLNHYSKGESFPEKYFREIFEGMKLEFKQEVRESIYSLDFVLRNNINIEIDGEQHYVDDRILEGDIRRNKYLENIGYEIRRVRWSEFQKLKKKERETFILELVS